MLTLHAGIKKKKGVGSLKCQPTRYAWIRWWKKRMKEDLDSTNPAMLGGGEIGLSGVLRERRGSPAGERPSKHSTGVGTFPYRNGLLGEKKENSCRALCKTEGKGQGFPFPWYTKYSGPVEFSWTQGWGVTRELVIGRGGRSNIRPKEI